MFTASSFVFHVIVSFFLCAVSTLHCMRGLILMLIFGFVFVSPVVSSEWNALLDMEVWRFERCETKLLNNKCVAPRRCLFFSLFFPPRG